MEECYRTWRNLRRTTTYSIWYINTKILASEWDERCRRVLVRRRKAFNTFNITIGIRQRRRHTDSPQTGQFAVRISEGKKCSRLYPPRSVRGRRVDPHLASTLSMSRAVRLLDLYACMSRNGATFTFNIAITVKPVTSRRSLHSG